MGLFDGTPLERPVLCDRCGQVSESCTCLPVDTLPSKQALRVRLDKRKRGKWVTVVTGFGCSMAQIQETLGYLQSQCGAGGTIDDQNIELQGDHTMRLPSLLESRGYRIAKGK